MYVIETCKYNKTDKIKQASRQRPVSKSLLFNNHLNRFHEAELLHRCFINV
jgi:hypothetical protein